MLAGTDDHLTWLSPVILNLENMGLTHLESEIRVQNRPSAPIGRDENFVNFEFLEGRFCKEKPSFVH